MAFHLVDPASSDSAGLVVSISTAQASLPVGVTDPDPSWWALSKDGGATFAPDSVDINGGADTLLITLSAGNAMLNGHTYTIAFSGNAQDVISDGLGAQPANVTLSITNNVPAASSTPPSQRLSLGIGLGL